MPADQISKVEIDACGRLLVFPSSADLAFVYRAGMEVNWDEALHALYSPNPREWSYAQWFQQLLGAAHGEYGVVLSLTPQTQWKNVDLQTKDTILASVGSGA